MFKKGDRVKCVKEYPASHGASKRVFTVGNVYTVDFTMNHKSKERVYVESDDKGESSWHYAEYFELATDLSGLSWGWSYPQAGVGILLHGPASKSRLPEIDLDKPKTRTTCVCRWDGPNGCYAEGCKCGAIKRYGT